MERQHLSQTKNAIAQRAGRHIASSNRESAIARYSTYPIEELQGAIGNRAVNKLLANQPTLQAKPMFRGLSRELVIQPKLSIGAVGDKYEQEADRVAADVVQRINQPEVVAPLQRETLQRQELPEEEELQMKPLVQRREAIAGGEASTDLASAINSARGGGQPLDAGLQRSMGQTMEADFSGVRVHADAESDRLNQSIQAKAFTTGQDVFFRQGAYQPESRGGQELIAHELTHVMQQKSGLVQRVPIDKTTASTRELFFKNKYFSRVPYAAQFGNADANQEIRDLWSQAFVKPQNLSAKQKLVTPNPIYTFDLQKTLPTKARGFYGYNNPAKNSAVGLEILSKGLNLNTPPHTLAEESDATWHSTNARYASQRPGSAYTDFSYNDAILGHDEGHGIQGASDHFNQIGHQQDKAANTAWNQDPNNYWGPEHTNESAASGAASPAYRVPLEESGSDMSWL
jgi:Domain of unknown function (DUF4157)